MYICGDFGAVMEAKQINKNIVGTITQKFNGKDKFMLSVGQTLDKIKSDFVFAQNEFYNNPEKFKIKLPKKFTLQLKYVYPEQAKLHAEKYKDKLKQITNDILEYTTADYFDLLTVMRLMKLKIKE